MSLSFIISGTGTINAFANGRAYVIPASHRNYQKAKAALRTGDADTFIRAVDYVEAVKALSPHARQRVEVVNNQVLYDGKPIHNVVTRRILELHADGWPWAPVANFLDNVQQNPSYRAVQELYTFLEHRALPLTENGHFLAYKAVKADWTDKHTGTFDNSVGKVVSVPRNTVNDDFREGCSNGLHVGSIEYVNGFKQGGDHVVICRVNPRDVVSVPLDSGCTKLRCCEYEVVGEYTGDLTGLVYTARGEAVPPPSRNDPAQAVTTAPPPRDGGQWSGVDPGAPEGDKTVVAVVDGYNAFSPSELAPDEESDFTADDVGLGPKIPMDEDNDAEDDEQVLAAHENENNDWGDDGDGDDDDPNEGDSDLEYDDFDNDLEDDSDIEDSDLEDSADSDLEDDEFDGEPAVSVNLDDDPPLAEAVTDPHDAPVDTASWNHPYNFNVEYGGES